MKPKPSRRLLWVQINLAELNSLDPLLRARIIERAHRESVKNHKHQQFLDSLDVEEDP